MAAKKRPTKTANKNYVTNFGKVRVETHKGGYRVRRYDREKKTTVDIGFFQDKDSAVELARATAHEDALRNPTQSSSATLALLGEKALSRDLNLDWSANTRANWESLFRQHIANTKPRPGGAKPIGNRLAKEITAADLGEFIRDKALKENLSRSMISKLIQLLRKIADQAVEAGIWNAANNPTTNLAIPSSARGKSVGLHLINKADIPSETQIKALRAALATVDAKYAVMCDIAAGCGLRLGELLALRHEDISIKNRTIRVERQVIEEPGVGPVVSLPKTEAGVRTVVIPRSIMPAVRAHHRKFQRDDYLFTDSKGNFILRANFNQVLNGRISNGRRVSKGVYHQASWPKNFTWHTLRHYAITSWLKAGLNIVDVSEMAGHSSPSTTMKKYVGTDRAAASRAARIL